MGQKVHPYGFRLGYIKDWHSNWYAKDKIMVKHLEEDLAIRKYIEKNMKNAAVAKTEFSRTSDQVKVTVYTAKPGVAIGKKGAGIDKIRNDLKKLTKGTTFFNIAEVKRPDAEAKLLLKILLLNLKKVLLLEER